MAVPTGYNSSFKEYKLSKYKHMEIKIEKM